jgi:hypothetical protein
MDFVSRNACRCVAPRPLVVAALAGLWLIGCRSNEPLTRRAAQDAGQCIRVMSLGDWQVIDTDHLLIWGESLDWAYRITLTRPLLGMTFEETIAAVDNNRDGRICAFGGDGILTRECVGIPVTIAAIDRLSIAQTKAATASALPAGGRKATTCDKPPT